MSKASVGFNSGVCDRMGSRKMGVHNQLNPADFDSINTKAAGLKTKTKNDKVYKPDPRQSV